MPRRKKHTKKAGAAGRFGPRYGTRVKKRLNAIEQEMRRPHRCPRCGALKIKRVGTAIWQCRRCGAKFAGAAYTPSMRVVRAPTEEKEEVRSESEVGASV